MAQDRPCVRCGVVESEHVTTPRCPAWVEPAPWWMRLLTGV